MEHIVGATEPTRSLMHGLSRSSRDTDRYGDTDKRCQTVPGGPALSNVFIEGERAPNIEVRASHTEKSGHLIAVTGERGRERVRERGGRSSARSSRASTPSKPSLTSMQNEKEKRNLDKEKEPKTDEEKEKDKDKEKEKEPCKLKEREKRGMEQDPMTARRHFWYAAIVAVAVKERLYKTVAEEWGRKMEARKQLRAGWLILRACLRFRGERYSALQLQLMKRHRAAVKKLIRMVREITHTVLCRVPVQDSAMECSAA